MSKAKTSKKRLDRVKRTDEPYWKMNAQELAEATGEFDRPISLAKTRPLSPAERRLWARARKPGRPQVGQGAVRVPFSMELGLLEALDAFARERAITRSGLIAAAVREYMTRASAAGAAPAVNGRTPARQARAPHGPVVK